MAKRYIQNPQDPSKYIVFEDGATDADIAEAMESLSSGAPAAPAVPDVPWQPVPDNFSGAPGGDPPLPAIAPDIPGDAAAPSTEGWRRGSLLPIKKKVNIDESGQMADTGEWDWGIPTAVDSAIKSVEAPGKAMRGELDPMSEEGFEDVMGIAGMATGVNPAVRSAATKAVTGTPAAVESVLSKVSPEPPVGAGFVEEAINSIKQRFGGENTPRPQIIRQEAAKLYKDYGQYMTAAQKAEIQKLAEPPGLSRRALEAMSSRKPLSLGLDLGTAAGASGLGFFQGPGLGFAAMGARVAGGLADKALVGASKFGQSIVNKNQINKMRKAVPPSTRRRKRQPLENQTNVEPKAYPPTKTPRQVKESMPRPPKEKPAAGSGAGIGALTKDPKRDIKPQGVQGPLAVANPSGNIKMNIGAPEPKKTGTDPNFLRAQKQAKADAEKKRKEQELSYRQGRVGTAQPAPPVAIKKVDDLYKQADSVLKSDRITAHKNDPKYQEHLAKTPATKTAPGKQGRVLPKGAKEPEVPKPAVKTADLQLRLDRAKEELDLTKYIDSTAKMQREADAIKKRIKYYEEEIARRNGEQSAPPKSVLSEPKVPSEPKTTPKGDRPKAPAKKAAARQARNEKKIKSFADIKPEIAQKASDAADSKAIQLMKEVLAKRKRGRGSY